MLITTYRQQNETDLIIDTGLAQQILGEINTVNEKLSSRTPARHCCFTLHPSRLLKTG